MFPWWGPEDNHALLLYYHRHGVYLYRQNRVALQAWALDLLEASNIRIEFTVQVSSCTALATHACQRRKAVKTVGCTLSILGASETRLEQPCSPPRKHIAMLDGGEGGGVC